MAPRIGLSLDTIAWDAMAIRYGVPALSALAVLLVGIWLARWLSRRALPRVTHRFDPMLGAFLANATYMGAIVIVVVVAMDFRAQVSAHLVSHQYESLLKKANLRRT